MQYTIILMRKIMELFCAPALASVAAACIANGNLYPKATIITKVLINGFYPEYGPLISVKTQIIGM